MDAGVFCPRIAAGKIKQVRKMLMLEICFFNLDTEYGLEPVWEGKKIIIRARKLLSAIFLSHWN